MEVEHAVRVFPLDDKLQDNLREVSKEGYMAIPGITPVVVYHLVRVKGLAPGAPGDGGQKPMAKIAIDDTKVKILRNGELIDGT